MNWDAVTAISSTIASIAVVLSLIYLSLQIKQSNTMSQSQTRVELRHMANAETTLLITYPEIQECFDKEELTERERIRLHFFLVTACRFREFIWRQHRLGLLDTETFQYYMTAIIQLLSVERVREWWDEFKASSYDPEYIALIDELLASKSDYDFRNAQKALTRKEKSPDTEASGDQ